MKRLCRKSRQSLALSSRQLLAGFYRTANKFECGAAELSLVARFCFCCSHYLQKSSWGRSRRAKLENSERERQTDRWMPEIDRQIGRQEDRQQSRCTNTAEVNAITETSCYFVAFHHHHLSRFLALSPSSFMAGFLIDDKAIYVSLTPPPILLFLPHPSLMVSPFFSLSSSVLFFFVFSSFFLLSFSICVSTLF